MKPAQFSYHAPKTIDEALALLARVAPDDGRVLAVQYEFTIAHSSGEVWPDRPKQTGVCRCRDSKVNFKNQCTLLLQKNRK